MCSSRAAAGGGDREAADGRDRARADVGNQGERDAGARRPQPCSRWDLSIESDPEDESGFGSLRILLSVVLAAANALRALQREYEMRIGWGGFSDSTQGDFVLEADLVQGVAALGLPIHGTAYAG